MQEEVEFSPLRPHHLNVINEIIKKARLEETSTFLPDLYVRKFRLVEKLSACRTNYVMATNMSEKKNMPIQRKIINWDAVLEEVKWRAIELKEERKFKQAISYHLAKKMKRQVTKRMYINDEI